MLSLLFGAAAKLACCFAMFQQVYGLTGTVGPHLGNICLAILVVTYNSILYHTTTSHMLWIDIMIYTLHTVYLF